MWLIGLGILNLFGGFVVGAMTLKRCQGDVRATIASIGPTALLYAAVFVAVSLMVRP